LWNHFFPKELYNYSRQMSKSSSTIDPKSEINDLRQPGDFKGYSFSNFKNSEVKKSFRENMLKGKIEPACYWCAELLCAGHYMDVWESILHFVGKYIHLGNPKVIIYLERRFLIFRDIMTKGRYATELQLRNNDKIRKLFAEIISVLTYSNKKHSFEAIKINREDEFDITQMNEKLKAPSIHYAEGIMMKNDPKELLIAVNEFAYHISRDCKNMTIACYWFEWVVEFDNICKKRKEPCYCDRRMNIPVENKFQCDIVWILWDCIFHYGNEMQNVFISSILKSLLELVCIKYTTASSKKRRYLFYFAIALLTEPVPTNIELISNKESIQSAIDNIDEVYKQIKKNEITPNTDYLFANIEKQNNFEKSVKKMEMLEKFDMFSEK
jgi:hypothetical protein